MNVDALMVAIGAVLTVAYVAKPWWTRLMQAVHLVDDAGLDILDAEQADFYLWEDELDRTASGPVDDADHLWLDPWGFVTPGGDS